MQRAFVLDDWLPYHPKSRVAMTCVRLDGAPARLKQIELPGTARPDERRAIAEGEGIWWVRGHVDEDSPEGQALLAAHALSRSRTA